MTDPYRTPQQVRLECARCKRFAIVEAGQEWKHDCPFREIDVMLAKLNDDIDVLERRNAE